jgi:hypothetical protein
MLLATPIADLRLEAIAPVFVRGRLLQAGRGVAQVPLRIRWRTAFGTAVTTGASDADGRFDLGVGRPAAGTESTADLLVAAPDEGIVHQESFGVAGDDTIDLGDIDLGDPLRVVVRDAGGEPVGAAVVRVETAHGGFTAAMTARDGTGLVPWLPAAARQVTVHARGFRAAAWQVTPARGDPLVLVLERGNGLDVIAAVRAGCSPHGLLVQVSAPHMPFVAAGEAGEEAAAQRAFRQRFAFDANGRVELHDLLPGTLLQLAVLDACGSTLVTRRSWRRLPGASTRSCCPSTSCSAGCAGALSTNQTARSHALLCASPYATSRRKPERMPTVPS